MLNLPRVVAIATLALLCGCAAASQRQPDPHDRLEGFNRGMFRFNMAVDRAVIRPVARGYRRVTPTLVRRGLAIIDNPSYPQVIVADVLQGKLGDADATGASPATAYSASASSPGHAPGSRPTTRFRRIQNAGQTNLRCCRSSADEPARAPKRCRTTTSVNHYFDDPGQFAGASAAHRLETRTQPSTPIMSSTAYRLYASRNAWLKRREPMAMSR
jgi:hypothetical protein